MPAVRGIPRRDSKPALGYGRVAVLVLTLLIMVLGQRIAYSNDMIWKNQIGKSTEMRRIERQAPWALVHASEWSSRRFQISFLRYSEKRSGNHIGALGESGVLVGAAHGEPADYSQRIGKEDESEVSGLGLAAEPWAVRLFGFLLLCCGLLLLLYEITFFGGLVLALGGASIALYGPSYLLWLAK